MNEEFNIGNAARQYEIKDDINTAEESDYYQFDYDELDREYFDNLDDYLDRSTIDFLKKISVEHQNARKLAKQVRSCRCLNSFFFV